MSYLSMIVSFILVNFHSVREAAEETLEQNEWEQNRDLQILGPTHRNLGEETEGVETNILIFCKPPIQLYFSSFIFLNSAQRA